MRLTFFVLHSLVLVVLPVQAAFFYTVNEYHMVGTWNDDARMTAIFITEPLGHGVVASSWEGEIKEDTLVPVSFMFPKAPSGARNVLSEATVTEIFAPTNNFTMTVEPIVKDCNGVPCKYEPVATVSSGTFVYYWFQTREWDAPVTGVDGGSFDATVWVAPRTVEVMGPSFAFNSKTVMTWGPSSYDFLVRASTSWEADARHSPEPGSWVMVGLGAGLFALVTLFSRST